MCSISHEEIPATKRFTSPSFSSNLPHSSVKSACSSVKSDLSGFLPILYKSISSKGLWWTGLDYTMYWPIIHWEIKPDKVTGTALNRYICKGFTMESVYWSHRGRKKNVINLYMKQNKDKIWGQNIIQKRYKMHNLHTLQVRYKPIQSL